MFEDGHYARKQLGSRSWLIAWSHGARFRTGLRLARRFARGRRVLDYGCGDGTFLALLAGTEDAPPALGVGAEVDPAVVRACNERLGSERLRFVAIDDLEQPDHVAAYDAVVCMEVLEHVVDPDAIVDRLARALAPGGTLLASVPVETGLPVLVKQAARRVAGWRGIGDYPGTTPYTWGELARSILAGKRQHIVRPVHTGAGGAFHDHKGFNWRALRERLGRRFEIDRTLASPLGWLPPDLGSQAWFLGHLKG